MLKFDDIKAARTKLLEARLELRQLAMQCETGKDWMLLTTGFSANGSKIANYQIWCLLGLNAAEARAILDRVREDKGPWGRDIFGSPEEAELIALESQISPWDESFEDALEAA